MHGSMTLRCLLPALASLALLSLPAARAEKPAPVTPGPVLPAVEKAAATLPAGGFVLAEVQDGKVTFAAAGHPGPSAGVPPEKVLFEIGSITKVFTSLLLAEAVNEGRTKLTDPIGKFLPADVTLAPETAAITLEQLATHTSGMPALPTNFQPADQMDPYADYSAARLYDFLRAYRPDKPVPQPASYSNVGVGLLGHLLERIFGQSYAELVATRITGPLGMTDTVIALSADQQARFATPYSGSTAVKPWHLDALAGAGALHSTAADLARLAQALLKPDHTPLAAAWELARQPRAPFGARGQVGLNILIVQRNGKTVYNHSGGTGGFRSYLELTPASGLATVLWLNNDTVEPGMMVASVRRPPAPAAAPAAREEQPIEAARLADYAGVYAIDARARFTFLVDDAGRLRGRLTGQAFLPVFHAGHDRFFARAVAAEFQFHRDGNGQIDTVTLLQNGQEVPAKRTTEPVPTVRFLAAEQATDYVGHFELKPGILFEVTARGPQLLVKLTGQPAFPVFCDQPDHFVYDVVVAALSFERDAHGVVTAVVLHQHGMDQRAPRVAEAK